MLVCNKHLLIITGFVTQIWTLAPLNIQQNWYHLNLDFRWTFCKLTYVNKQITWHIIRKMNTKAHQPVKISAHCEQLATDTIGGSFWFYILLTRTSPEALTAVRATPVFGTRALPVTWEPPENTGLHSSVACSCYVAQYTWARNKAPL